jgi:hypothetical protein
MNSAFVFARLGLAARLALAAVMVSLIWIATLMVIG